MIFTEDLGSLGVVIEHHMPDDGSGVYVKETFIPAGTTLLMHSHTFTHKSVLVSGSVRLTSDGISQDIEAPKVLTLPAGGNHEVTAIRNAMWLCVHATEVCDPENIDHAITGG